MVRFFHEAIRVKRGRKWIEYLRAELGDTRSFDQLQADIERLLQERMSSSARDTKIKGHRPRVRRDELFGVVVSWRRAEREPESAYTGGSQLYYIVFHEIELNPGEQYTTPANTSHWFQVSDKGAIVSEFSSTNRDEFDSFRDLGMKLIPEVAKD